MLRPLFLFIISLSLALPAHAQLYRPVSTERLTIDISPAFPGANENVFLSVRAISTDLDRSVIEWYIDDTLVTSGEGQRGATVTLGALGSQTRVSVIVVSEAGDSLSAERTLRPAEVDLLWEGTSYVPPFYQGKRLVSPGTSIRAEALTRLRQGSETIPPRDIVYTWSRNDAIVSSASGRGRSAATFLTSELASDDVISVEAASLDGTLTAAASTQIPSTDPFVMLYQDHPLFGVLYHAAIAVRETFPDIEATFAAIPFFASALHPNDPRLVYEWRVNGTGITADPADPSRLTINAENSDGTARTELSVTHATNYTMNASGIWGLVFNSGLESLGADLFGAPQ